MRTSPINEINDLPGSQELKRAMPVEEKKKKETTEELPEMKNELNKETVEVEADTSDESMAALDEEIQQEET